MSQTIRYECPADTSYIGIIDQFTEAMLQGGGWDDCQKFCFAAHELVINSIEAMKTIKYLKKKDNHIVVRIFVNNKKAIFSVTDQAQGIPSDKLEKTDCLEQKGESMDESGRGLMLIKQFVDEFIIKENVGAFTYCIIKNR